MNQTGLVVLVLILAAIFFVLGPIVVIWSLNTLFTLAIPYTFKTWLAAFILIMVLSARSVKVKQ